MLMISTNTSAPVIGPKVNVNKLYASSISRSCSSLTRLILEVESACSAASCRTVCRHGAKRLQFWVDGDKLGRSTDHAPRRRERWGLGVAQGQAAPAASARVLVGRYKMLD